MKEKLKKLKNWYNTASLKMDFIGISAPASTEGSGPALARMPMPVKPPIVKQMND